MPSNLVQRVITSLIEDGEVDYSYLGIAGADMTLDTIETFDLPNNLQGAVVNAVVDGSPADEAGLRNPSQNSTDIITAIDGTRLTAWTTCWRTWQGTPAPATPSPCRLTAPAKPSNLT